MSESFRLGDDERKSLDENGFLIRHDVFTREECRQMGEAVEQLERDMLAAKRTTKHTVGSYMFELQREMQSVVKWEPDHPDVVQGIEPFAHISEPLDHWARDARLWNPAKDVIGQENIGLFTEKITMKRAHTGGSIILHQDYPYWRNQNKVAHKVMTAMIQLDDASVRNGCLEVLPGSHRDGWNRITKNVDGFGANELDDSQFDLNQLVPVESEAGSVIYFGAFLIHRSLPNKSNRDRRALLYSYQPGGYPSGVEINRLLAKKVPEPETVN
ncbi:MAG TPA: phytanoyl-CoA dioxygenase family protein [Rhizomicrobium sp.]|jgi:ectoine hydroxylase